MVFLVGGVCDIVDSVSFRIRIMLRRRLDLPLCRMLLVIRSMFDYV